MIDRLKPPATGEQFDHYPPGGWDIFYRDRQLPWPGSLLVQPGLANTLRSMVSSSDTGPGSRADGIGFARHAFYQGPVAKTIADNSQRLGGILDLRDLAGYRSKYEQPVSTTFKGYEIWGQSTWTQGPMLMQTLNILEHFDLRQMGHNSPAYIHTVAEALKLAFAGREAYYGDPDFSQIPIDGLLSKEYAAERARLIDADRAHPELLPAANPGGTQRAETEPALPQHPFLRELRTVATQATTAPPMSPLWTRKGIWSAGPSAAALSPNRSFPQS